jgi:hypothetical protein
VLRFVAEFAVDPNRPTTVRIDLDELRRRVDPDGGGVRDAGARLGRAGAILERGRDAHGAFWRVHVERAARALSEAGDGRSGGGSGAAQLS